MLIQPATPSNNSCTICRWQARSSEFPQAELGSSESQMRLTKRPLLLALFALSSFAPLKAEDRAASAGDDARVSGVPSSQRDPKSDWLVDFKKHLPGWLGFGGQYRGRVEGQTGREFIPGNNDFYYLSQLRLDLNIRVCSNLRLMFQGQDSHAPGFRN